MKKLHPFLVLFVCFSAALIFMGCPVSTSYPLGEKNSEKIDKRLIGTWKNDSTSNEAVKVTVKKTDEYTYKVTVDEKGSMFMAESTDFIGWITTIEKEEFLVVQEEIEGVAKETYYVYHIKFENGKLITNDITLKVGGTDAITSIPTYRDEVKASMQKEGFLAGTIVWKKL